MYIYRLTVNILHSNVSTLYFTVTFYILYIKCRLFIQFFFFFFFFFFLSFFFFFTNRSPTLFLIILKNHLIQFQKVNFFQDNHSKIE